MSSRAEVVPEGEDQPPASKTAAQVLPPDWRDRGLSAEAVASREELRLDDRAEARTSQSLGQIFRRNALTRLNFLLVTLGGATLVTGSAPDATFLLIAVINSVVGSVQEVRAKRSLDALAVINAPRARVIRDGQVREIEPERVVVDDLLDLRPGDQVTADAVVVADEGELDESLATGESDPVPKAPGDALLSGSWMVAGVLRARVVQVGSDSYANRLAAEARRFSLASSELMSGINSVLRALSWAMVVIGPVLFIRQLQSAPWRVAIRTTVAGLVGMVPEGLVLLTTLAFLTSAVRLARREVLVQELPAVETLARVDALCVDKTGTLTEGGISFAGLQASGATSREEIETALASLARSRDANSTMIAIREGLPSMAVWEPQIEVPFASSRKWSGATYAGHGSWVLGAMEFVTAADPDGLGARAAQLAMEGARVLIVARGWLPFAGDSLPADLTIMALVELRERLRPEVSDTLSYFARQQVTVRVISGDSPATVGHLAQRVGLPDSSRVVDARALPSPAADFAEAVEANRVFGRVTPEQKREMVNALQSRGHTVAMTGDGVNDVLALKDADLGIAMGSGTSITRGVAQVVILDDDFDVLPAVVSEGRRVLGNIERVASLFLVKNVYSLLLSVAIAITGWPYPFLPRHLTLISAVGIGIPGFFLALAPNEERFQPGFLRRTLTFSIMAGTVTAATVMGTYASARQEGLSGDAARTAAILAIIVITLWVLVIVSRPLTPLRALLVAAMAGIFIAAYFTPGVNTFFSLQHPPQLDVVVESLVFGGLAGLLIDVLHQSRAVSRVAGRLVRARPPAPPAPADAP